MVTQLKADFPHSSRCFSFRSPPPTWYTHALRPAHLHRGLCSHRQRHGTTDEIRNDMLNGHWHVQCRPVRLGLELQQFGWPLQARDNVRASACHRQLWRIRSE